MFHSDCLKVSIFRSEKPMGIQKDVSGLTPVRTSKQVDVNQIYEDNHFFKILVDVLAPNLQITLTLDTVKFQ